MLITIQNVITIVLIATSLTIGLQIRHLISAPMGYNTADILDVSTEIFTGKPQIAQFREELLREPCVEAVALGCGTPHDRGNNNTMQYGPDRMIGFQIFIGDSTYFRILGLERLRDNHLATREDGNNALFVNQYALQALGIAEDATNFKVGENYTYNYDIAGVYRDFQLGSALDELQPVLLKYYDSPEEFLKRRIPGISWSKSTGTKPRPTIRSNRYSNVFPRCGLYRGGVYRAGNRSRLCPAAAHPAHRRHLYARGDPDLGARSGGHVDLLHPAKEQEVAVRKVFGSTRGEVLTRLVGNFMRLVGAAFVIAVPVAWYLLERWLQDYSVRISLSPLISWPRGLLPPRWHSLPSSGRAAVRPIPTRSTRLKTKKIPGMKNFLFALRYLRKLRGGTVARVISLSLGLAVGLLIFSYANYNLTSDRCFRDGDRIYQLWVHYNAPQMTGYSSSLQAPIAPALAEEIPQIEAATRLWGTTSDDVVRGDNSFPMQYILADTMFFDVLGFDVLQGDPHRALAQENQVMISESAARTIFGKKDPVGELLLLKGTDSLTVSGVFRDPDPNQHLGKFNMLRSFEYARRTMNTSWRGGDSFASYVKLREGVQIGQVEAQAETFIDRHELRGMMEEWGMKWYFFPITESSRVDSSVELISWVLMALAALTLSLRR